MNCHMIGRVVSVGVGLLGVCFAVAAQQANSRASSQHPNYDHPMCARATVKVSVPVNVGLGPG